MDNLYKQIENLQQQDWNYYAGAANNLDISKPFSSDNTSANFILQYFKKGGKEEAVKDFNIEAFGIQRADHTVSIFFLGLLLNKHTKLKEKMEFGLQASQLYEFFQFIWFVTCLSHDAAFYLEKNKNLFKTCRNLSALKKHLKIEFDLTSLTVPKVPDYMFRLCDAYFCFRHKHHSFKSTDHGIYAGVLLYDRLVKNRLSKKAKSDKEYLWEDYLDAEYAYAAATVAVHNIWFPEVKDTKLYEKYKLDSLIGRQPIRYSDAPLLFLLGLIDTIDPVKAYPCVTPEFVLSNISLVFSDDSTFELHLSRALNFEIMKDKATYLKKWLYVDTEVMGRIIKITILD